MRRHTLPVTVAALAGMLAATLATPAAADGWGWGGHQGWGRPGWGGGYRGGNWNGGAAAAAALGGFALGAVAGSVTQQPAYAGGYYGGGCYMVDRPVTDGWGNVIEYRRAQICD